MVDARLRNPCRSQFKVYTHARARARGCVCVCGGGRVPSRPHCPIYVLSIQNNVLRLSK